MKKSKVIFNAKALEKQLLDYWVEEQSNRLVEYAKRKILIIGGYIKNAYTYKFDRTGNLLDSLCWVVSYNGKLVEGGFYRDQRASRESYLHELFDADTREMFPIYGHGLAQQFINEYGSKSGNGQWSVYFAILAPYWGYWEEGHHNVLTHNFERFAAMAEMYDSISKDLKPSKVRFLQHSRPTYNTHSKNSLKSMKKSMDDPYKEKRHYSRYPRM